MDTKKCNNCGTKLRVGPGTWWAKNGIPDNCPNCRQPYNKPAVQPDSAASFGVGGVGIYSENEAPMIPTEKALERYERMERKAYYCKSCGKSDVFDGAMFTTNARPGYCDDCGG